MPIFVSGDFNTYVGLKTYNMLITGFTDSKMVAPSTDTSGTYKDSDEALDMIFINNRIFATKFDVIKDRPYQYGITSDHYPIILKAYIL